MYISVNNVIESLSKIGMGVIVAVFRYQVTSVGMWRGKVKRWNTTFHYGTANNTAALYAKMQAAGYKEDGDVVGACSGGTASISVYYSTGGPPISNTIYFDWSAPATWIPYAGTLWATVPSGTPTDAAGESALVVIGHMPGLSASGKPVTTRKFLHAVPSRSSADYSDPDVDATTQAAAVALFPTSYMLNPAGSSPATVTCAAYYLSHQRVRGRRRTVKQVGAQSFSAGVVLGTTVPGSGGLPFQNQ